MPSTELPPPDHLPIELLSRCHANALEDYRAFARVTAGAAVEEEPGSVFVDLAGGDSLENVAFFTEAPTDPTEALGRAIRFFRRRKRPWSVLLVPKTKRAMRPALAARGFLNEGRFPGMILRPLPERGRKVPDGFVVRRAETLADLEDIQRAASHSYGVPYERPDPDWLRSPAISLYAGYSENEPVAHGALIVAYGIAGIAYVGTVPEGRRRGFASALVDRILVEGHRRGCDAAYLWATPMGFAVYERLGFERVLDYEIWSAPGAPLPPAIRGTDGRRRPVRQGPRQISA